ncbi:hypothetical protein AAT19DRAFT_12156 [Rhodotorula toruloides]|uniref:Uncharacterized protein n=1 Tax=Rhodotorula toruloides TaxID=5286 RepID=A0A2T0AFG6_RHOTO|nr:hypothetical protein AAT19DRAFT_12156 [Rhodotorula toruloides]
MLVQVWKMASSTAFSSAPLVVRHSSKRASDPAPLEPPPADGPRFRATYSSGTEPTHAFCSRIHLSHRCRTPKSDLRKFSAPSGVRLKARKTSLFLLICTKATRERRCSIPSLRTKCLTRRRRRTDLRNRTSIGAFSRLCSVSLFVYRADLDVDVKQRRNPPQRTAATRPPLVPSPSPLCTLRTPSLPLLDSLLPLLGLDGLVRRPSSSRRSSSRSRTRPIPSLSPACVGTPPRLLPPLMSTPLEALLPHPHRRRRGGSIQASAAGHRRRPVAGSRWGGQAD